MKMFAYGEDALTLWALRHKLGVILQKLDPNVDQGSCRVYFRPSFGRRGGDNSAQFGEFDFIILGNSGLYLGESKWDRSPVSPGAELQLRAAQLTRHAAFRVYVEEWFNYSGARFDAFLTSQDLRVRLSQVKPTPKPPAPPNSLLAQNLEAVLRSIREYYHDTIRPVIQDVLLYLYVPRPRHPIPLVWPEGFKRVETNYSEALQDNYIVIDL